MPLLYGKPDEEHRLSGVDEDEEALNLVKFQYSYNMASKIISVMNQMLDKLINDTGVTYNRRLPMRKFTTRIYTKANYLLNLGRMALSNQRGTNLHDNLSQ